MIDEVFFEKCILMELDFSIVLSPFANGLKKTITCDITCSYWALARRRRGFGKRKFSEPTFNFSRFLISKVFKHNVGNACAFVTRSMLIHMKLHIKGKLVVCFSISPNSFLGAACQIVSVIVILV